MIPMIMKLRVHNERFRMNLWIPLILFWLPLLVMLLLMLPFLGIAWLVVWLKGWRIPMLRLLSILVELLSSLRTAHVSVTRSGSGAGLEISLM
jgi:hypothetical protein